MLPSKEIEDFASRPLDALLAKYTFCSRDRTLKAVFLIVPVGILVTKIGGKMINANSIQDMNHVKQILDHLKKYIKSYELQNGELSEDAWISLRFQLCEIDEFVIGIQNCNEYNFADADLRMMSYYRYLNNEYSFDKLVENLRKYEGQV